MRARHEAMAAPLDLALQSTWRELLKLPDLPAAQFDENETPGPLCEVRLRKGDIAVGLIGTVLTLGTPQDITLQELTHPGQSRMIAGRRSVSERAMPLHDQIVRGMVVNARVINGALLRQSRPA